jgi:hypothetical protein
MSIVKFVRQESEHLLRVKLGETEPLRSSAICPYKKWKKMLYYFYDQVTYKLLMGSRESR